MDKKKKKKKKKNQLYMCSTQRNIYRENSSFIDTNQITVGLIGPLFLFNSIRFGFRTLSKRKFRHFRNCVSKKFVSSLDVNSTIAKKKKARRNKILRIREIWVVVVVAAVVVVLIGNCKPCVNLCVCIWIVWCYSA